MSRRHRLALSAALALAAFAGPTTSQLDECTPEWLPTFGGMPAKANVYSLARGDDGGGGQLELFIGGSFWQEIGGPGNCIAKWDGWGWEALGSGMEQANDRVQAIVVHDEGDGPPIVYAGGRFSTAGGQPASNIAQWDGSNWAPLGSGVSGTGAEVRALAVFDDGGGPALYAAGTFSTAGGVTAGRIARWDGSSWSPVGGGMSGGEVKALTVFDDGSGPALYAAGTFSMAGGLPANRVAKWDGSTWSTLGTGVNGWVYALTTFDDGTGLKLYAAGSLSISGADVARWDGSNWTGVGTGLSNIVMALTTHDDGSGAGPQLYAAGDLFIGGSLRHIARLDGSAWTPLGGGLDSFAYSLTSYDDGGPDGPDLFVGGIFDDAGDVFVNGLGRWSGAEWSPVGSGFNGRVYASTIFDDGSGAGPALYVGGSFTQEYGGSTGGIAQWNGATLATVAGGMNGGVNGGVRALTVFDDGRGGGPALYAGGQFTAAGGVPASRAAMWDGMTWSPLGVGLNGNVLAWAVFDDGSGSGPTLYAGGQFTSAGGTPANRVARWDGTSWSALGDGVDGNVWALAVYDDGSGSGPALYAGGAFGIAGGVQANRIARWDGSTWSALGSGVNDGASASTVLAITVYDDGIGADPVLLVGGDFTTAGAVPANRIATWDGESWAALGGGMSGNVDSFAVVDAGVKSPILYAGGAFTEAGGVPANRIASWDGTSWLALGEGVSDGQYSPGVVLTMTAFDDGLGGSSSLFIGGDFVSAGDSGDSFLAKWSCPAEPSAWEDLGFGLAGTAGVPNLAGTGTLAGGSPGSLTLTSAKPSSLTNLFVSFASIPTPFKGGTLVPVPPALTLGLFTNGAGSIPLAWPSWPAGVPSGASLYFQYAIADPAAPAGVALSNALLATTP